MDARIKKVKHKYGIVGYGLYWYCIELIAFRVDKTNISFELEEDAETIALEWNIDQLKVQEIMLYLVELGLFEADNGLITCMKLAKRLDDTNSKNPEMRQVLAKLNGGKFEQLRTSPSISDQTILDETILDQTKQIEIKTSNKSSNDDDLKFLESITKHWNEIMTTQPRINLLDKTKATQTRIRAIKKIVKDYPNYSDHEYFEGYFHRLATLKDFEWQRENKQVTFDQATNLTKFTRNVELMRMGE